jgi:hypothetical protein
MSKKRTKNLTPKTRLSEDDLATVSGGNKAAPKSPASQPTTSGDRPKQQFSLNFTK